MDEPFFIPYDAISVGDSAGRDSVISEELVDRFSALIGDVNSFHVSDEAAARTVFQKRIVHGVHLISYLSTLIGQELPGFGTIYCTHTFEFFRPVYLGDTIRAELTVLEKLPRRRLRLRTVILNGAGETVLDGEAVVRAYR